MKNTNSQQTWKTHKLTKACQSPYMFATKKTPLK